MRKIAANYVFPVTTPPIKHGIVEVDEKGIIRNIRENPRMKEEPGLEFYSGMLIPGFVNAYASIETSLLRKTSEPLSNYAQLLQRRAELLQKPLSAKILHKWEKWMRQKGMVAAGNAVSKNHVDAPFSENLFRYHHFLELAPEMDFIPEKLQKALNRRPNCSLSPYALFGVTRSLLQKIIKEGAEKQLPLAFNNQRLPSEEAFWRTKTGPLVRLLTEAGYPPPAIAPTGKSSLQTALMLLPKDRNLMFAYNTFTTYSELQHAEAMHPYLYWALCPSAEESLGNPLPDARIFYHSGASVAIGTGDAPFSANTGILYELKLLQAQAPDIPLEILIRWATLNGAKALQAEKHLGSLEPGKSPGIILLKNLNTRELSLSPKAEVQVIC